ncbi:hypothetical protein A1O3_09750 [Capronia epimyces CBS 606.96]|uniref:Glutamine amidotransferase domain-containing protein n=1 Tax=Capronia epimyces CBS 606.96 TaxID=1182542 RepID=W9XBD4_9EURO|nr:uncharacterized protein A1O3_09750 [Capronia epimyces CBS 606.96]EXJ77523.1 hypothetical protein A1O3_09750 [Capronia epimyces CBS 606.96]
MIAKTPKPPRVAIIRDYELNAEWGYEMLDSIRNCVLKAQPEAEIQNFQPIDGGDVPDASTFDLVILTGGTADLTLPETDPWVTKVLDWIRDTVANSPTTKLLGICWGHQAISRAMGGTIAYREDGPLIEVQNVPLTEQGREFFKGYQSLRLHKFHRRMVKTAPPGFHYLADNHEISMSDSEQMMTFQGHPEMTAHIAQGLVANKDGTYLPDPSPEGVARLNQALEKDEDGKKAFARVMAWAFDNKV